MIEHHHFIYQAEVGKVNFNENYSEVLTQMLLDIVDLIEMNILIEPRVKKSKNNAWTGLVGIITSHIAFHYWIDEAYVQLDVYSCKPFEKEKLSLFLDTFWQAGNKKALYIERNVKEDFKIIKYF